MSIQAPQQVRTLVQEHLRLTDEPLEVAIYFKSASRPEDYCLFEIAKNFGHDEVDPDRHITHIAFGSTPEFPLTSGQYLHLWLTSPAEFKEAWQNDWNDVKELRDAYDKGEFELLQGSYHELLDMLSEANKEMAK